MAHFTFYHAHRALIYKCRVKCVGSLSTQREACVIMLLDTVSESAYHWRSWWFQFTSAPDRTALVQCHQIVDDIFPLMSVCENPVRFSSTAMGILFLPTRDENGDENAPNRRWCSLLYCGL